MCLAIPLADIMAYRKVSHRAEIQHLAACFSLSAAAQLCSRAIWHLKPKHAACVGQPYLQTGQVSLCSRCLEADAYAFFLEHSRPHNSSLPYQAAAHPQHLTNVSAGGPSIFCPGGPAVPQPRGQPGHHGHPHLRLPFGGPRRWAALLRGELSVCMLGRNHRVHKSMQIVASPFVGQPLSCLYLQSADRFSSCSWCLLRNAMPDLSLQLWLPCQQLAAVIILQLAYRSSSVASHTGRAGR